MGDAGSRQYVLLSSSSYFLYLYPWLSCSTFYSQIYTYHSAAGHTMEKVSIDSIFLTINQPILFRQRRNWRAMGPRRILRESEMILHVLDNRPYMQPFVSAIMRIVMWREWLCVNCGVSKTNDWKVLRFCPCFFQPTITTKGETDHFSRLRHWPNKTNSSKNWFQKKNI